MTVTTSCHCREPAAVRGAAVECDTPSDTGEVKPAICEQFGIDFPLFAFSHCRDVVAAVTNAGGFGVLGATAFTPQWLDQELSWIDEHVGGQPYGLDLIVPAKFEGKGEKLAPGELAGRIPEDYRDFVADLLAGPRHRTEASPPTGGRSSPATPERTCSRWRSATRSS